MFKSLVLSSGVKCTLFIFAFTKENQLKSKSHIRRIAIKHDWNNSMTQSIPKRSFDCTEFLRRHYFFDAKFPNDCWLWEHLHSLSSSSQSSEALRRRHVSSEPLFYGFFLWFSPLIWRTDRISKDWRGQSQQGNRRKRVGYRWQEIKRVPQPDVRELNLLGLCSGLLSYIRVKWAPPPRAQQDVAEEEGWEREMGFWHSGDTNSTRTALCRYWWMNLILTSSSLQSFMEDSRCYWMLFHYLFQIEIPGKILKYRHILKTFSSGSV